MGRERAVIVQLSRVFHVSPRVRPGEISRRLLALVSLALEKPPIRAFLLGLREGCFSARWPVREGLWASKRVGFISPEPVSTIYKLPIASIAILHDKTGPP
jgi:hypothetical protein